MLRFVPGLLGAIAAFVVLKLLSWVGSLSLELLVFLGTYAAVAVSVDTALKRYGRR